MHSGVVAVGALATVAALGVGACGGGGAKQSKASSGTTAAGPTTIADPASALRAALLSVGDVPGSTALPTHQSPTDLSGCFAGNPFGTRSDPGQSDGPDLVVTVGKAALQVFGSTARSGPVDAATSYVTSFSTKATAACVLQVVKASPTTTGTDTTHLRAIASTATVGDGAGSITISGPIKMNGNPSTLDAQLVAFRKAGTVVVVSVLSIGSTPPADKAVTLARAVAARL